MIHKFNLLPLFVAGLVAIAPTMASAKSSSESSKLAIPLVRHDSNSTVSGSIDFRSSKGRSQFRVRLKNGPASELVDLKVAGVSRGKFTTSSKGTLSLSFDSTPSSKSELLDFDPRGESVEINDQNDDNLLTSDDGFGGHPEGSSVDERANLQPTGVQPAAHGSARLRSKSGRAQFTVEIEDVTNGSYDLLVDGIARGTINTVNGQGEIEFGDSSSLPLDFDPFNKLVQVTLSNTVVLTGTVLASASGVNVCTPAETTTALIPTSLAPGASGEARLRIGNNCRHTFRVEAEDLTAGSYDLLVGGTLQGSILIVSNGASGEIEFSSAPDDDELPLNFDPAGASVDLAQGTNIFLSATVGNATTGTCTLVDSQVNLTNTGFIGGAKGKSRFRQDEDCTRDFRVEIEKLPAGNYDLHVGGVLRGTITVTLVASDLVGELEFKSTPEAGKLLLDFDPRGAAVEVFQGADLVLTVTMPN